MLVNNHTGVWGSWYDPSTGAWGYACCHSIIHISYCSGSAGIEAAQASSAQNLLASTPVSQPPINDATTSREEPPIQKVEQNYSKKRVGEGDVKLDKDSLARAMNEEKKRKLGGEDDDRAGKKRKNALDSGSHDVTEEELGAFLKCFHTLYFTHMHHRGLPNEPPDDGGPYGKLCRLGNIVRNFIILLTMYTINTYVL